MCGISGFIGYFDGYECALYGLKMLQNRGYDGAGICGINNNNFIIRKYASTPEFSAIKKLSCLNDIFSGCSVVCCQTRWRTHGAATDENAHPHVDYTGKISLVHNGIIENYSALKRELLEKNIPFKSQTDTEVISNLIGFYYNEGKNVEDAINMALNRLEGTWGLVILCSDTPNKMYCARHGSPLLIGYGDEFMMVASEQSGFSKYVNNYVCLNDHDIVVLEKKNGKVDFHKSKKYVVRKVSIKETEMDPAPYKHWMIKEINEQYDSSLRAMNMGSRIKSDSEVRLGGLEAHSKILKNIDHLILLGCGTSYHAGMMSMSLFKTISGFSTVQLFDGAEFEWEDIPRKGKTAILLMSQSGETKDLYRCIPIAKDKGLFTIGVVNVVDSLIARSVHCGVYLNAGREVAVASTKSFTSQVIVLHMIAVWFAQKRKINEARRISVITGLRNLPFDIKSIIQNSNDACISVAKYLCNYESTFVLGKGPCYAAALEAGLKIKEIGYVNAAGYSSNCLKHGSFSIIVDTYPILFILPNNKYLKNNLCVVGEVKSRGAYTIGISDISIDICDIAIKIPNNKIFAPLLSIIPTQLISYHMALIKGHSPDTPRNLCKVVSV